MKMEILLMKPSDVVIKYAQNLNLSIMRFILLLSVIALLAQPLSAQTCNNPDNYIEKIVEAFISKSEWQDERNRLSINNVSLSEIRTINSQTTCNILENEFSPEINETWVYNGDTYKKNEVYFYRTNDYYFAVIRGASHPDPQALNMSMTRMLILDSNFQILKGFIF